MSVPRVIMGIMYANVDSLCCRLSSRANKSGGSVTEQAANTERIKAGADVGSRGHQHAGAGLQNSSADADCEDNFPSSRVVTAEEGGGGKKNTALSPPTRRPGPTPIRGNTGDCGRRRKMAPESGPEGVAVDVDGAAGRKSLINKDHARHQEKRSREIWVVSRENG